MAQKFRQLELPLEGRGEAPRAERSEQVTPAAETNEGPGQGPLMEVALERSNLLRALKRVRGNKGSPGSDGMSLAELGPWLVDHWPRVKQALLDGSYEPQPVRQVSIPKPGGGQRVLGIPTVLDRLIQQALLQVLQPQIDPTFSDWSFGFRPGRSAHDAIRHARDSIQNGHRWVVDVDLAKFFDRVNHDILMNRMARRVGDKRVLKLIRRYLEAGVMADGVVVERYKGTPQGGPLSPLLANVLLDEVDQELERRGHAFARYADDLRVFVRSQKAGARVMRGLVKLFDKLKLQINADKSAVARATQRPFLGMKFWVGSGRRVKLGLASKALHRLKTRVRQITGRNRGRSLVEIVDELAQYLRGWRGYFRIVETPRKLANLDQWIRHRLRCYQLKQWKRGTTMFRKLSELGMSRAGAARIAANARRWWRNSAKLLNVALPNKHFRRLGLPSLAP